MGFFSNANWAGEEGYRHKYRLGIMTYYERASIYVSTCTKTVTALSSSQLEYIALAEMTLNIK